MLNQDLGYGEFSIVKIVTQTISYEMRCISIVISEDRYQAGINTARLNSNTSTDANTATYSIACADSHTTSGTAPQTICSARGIIFRATIYVWRGNNTGR